MKVQVPLQHFMTKPQKRATGMQNVVFMTQPEKRAAAMQSAVFMIQPEKRAAALKSAVFMIQPEKRAAALQSAVFLTTEAIASTKVISRKSGAEMIKIKIPSCH